VDNDTAMPTIFTHAIAGAAAAQVLAPSSVRRGMTWTAAACAMLPDADAVGFWMGVPYFSLFGHRGITHSLTFAGVAALGIAAVVRNRVGSHDLLRIAACIFLATASHGFLDAFTNGGLGVAFFSPFILTRYFFPVRPILVSSISVRGFFTGRGAAVVANEMIWVWCPAIMIILAAWYVRNRNAQRA